MTKAKAADTNPHDYLAVILIGAGSSHGRSADKAEAIKLAKRYLRDWESLFKLKGEQFTINVIDVIGYDDVQWGHDGIHGKVEATGKWEKITREAEHVRFIY